jgi:uncharacterized protein
MPAPSPVSSRRVPRLVGVIHLQPLPDSPRFEGDLERVVDAAARDARALAEAGFDGVCVENFGDAPFVPGPVSPVTIAAMTACARAARASMGAEVDLGVNVLRNDAEAALAVAIAASASFIRINVHTGARVTDQGLVEGEAHRTLRRRRALGADHVALLCDVDVKHSAALAARPIEEEAADLALRGLADAVLVTGVGTGHGVRASDLEAVVGAVRVPVLVASGVTAAALEGLRRAHGVIVGSCLRQSGRAGDPVDLALARRFVEEARARRFGA